VILLLIALALTLAPANWAQQRPFTQDQVQGLVRDGLGDESGAKLIEQRGIDFAPAEDFMQSLKAAGANEAFLKVLRTAKPPEPASAKKPLNQVQVFALLAGGVPSHRVAMLVNERGIDFEPQQDYLDEVRLGGGDDELIAVLKSANVTKPATVDPAAQARQAEVRQHVARGAEFFQKRQDAQAEQEYRAALKLDPQNADLFVALGSALLNQALLDQKKNDDAESAAREALRLNPNNVGAHRVLGGALGNKGDWYGQIAEYREALRLDPDSNRELHIGLGLALEKKRDWDGAIAEYREALRWYPKKEFVHFQLGLVLGQNSDWDGAIAEYREALRLNPNDEQAHVNLGLALAMTQNWDGAIAEYREALRLNPNDEQAHAKLGLALGGKGDWDGAIAEYREALRLNPNDALAHSGLGIALEGKGDRRGALEEWRAAYMLDPTNATCKQNYERLLQQVNR
jgi:tetratricopeptide (TPR) repeat protein